MSARTSSNILRWMEDDRLFRPWFSDGDWTAWKAYFAAKYALPMTPAMYDIFRACTERERPPSRPVKESVAKVGRRGGKTVAESADATYRVAAFDYRQYLKPGELGVFTLVACDRRQAMNAYNLISGFFDNISMLKKLVTNRSRESIELGDRRVLIEVRSCSHRSIRGITCVGAILDEVAWWRDESSTSPDVAVYDALIPATITIPTASISLTSTPHMRSGLFWNRFNQGFGVESDDQLVWSAPSWVMHPGIDRSVIDRAYLEDSQVAAAEYGAAFRSDLQAFVDAMVVDRCVAPSVREREPRHGTTYVAFCDPSGGSSDSMCLAIASHDADQDVAVLDCAREITSPFQPSVACAEFAAVLKSYGLTSCQGDHYSAAWVVDGFAQHGIRYEASAKPKSEIYLNMLAAMNSERVSLLDLPRLRAQLIGLERRTTRGGRDTVHHAPRAHDDLANACMGALLAAQVDCVPYVDFGAVNAGLARVSPWRDFARGT